MLLRTAQRWSELFSAGQQSWCWSVLIHPDCRHSDQNCSALIRTCGAERSTAKSWGLYLPHVNPYGIHGINIGWEHRGHHGFHCYSTWIPLDSIWNLGISTMDSMDKSIWIPWNSPYGFHGTSPCGVHGTNPDGINDYYIYIVLTILSKNQICIVMELNPQPQHKEQCLIKPPEPWRLCYTWNKMNIHCISQYIISCATVYLLICVWMMHLLSCV